MSTKTQIFITGATGHIGGAVLERLLKHSTASMSEVIALIRNADKAPLFASIGVKIVVGSHANGDLLERETMSCLLAEWYKQMWLTSGHSGTGVLVDNAKGMYAYDAIWDDTSPDQLETFTDTQFHRNVDLLVLAVDMEGYARTYIVLPSTIYDFANGSLKMLGIQNSGSIQIPKLVDASITHKRAEMVGSERNKWPNVHIDDIGDLYSVLYDAISDGRAGHGREGLYFGENDEHDLIAISEQISEALAELCVSGVDGHTPMSFDAADYARPRNRFLMFLGTNSRCKANRARALGWEPKHRTEDMLKSIRGEVEWQLEHKINA